MAIEVVSEARLFDGQQTTYRHRSDNLNCGMNFAVYVPDRPSGKCLFWLSGLTCTEENFTTKAGAQRVASELGLTLVAPDTSPRGDGVPDDVESSYDFGLGAGFYLRGNDGSETSYISNFDTDTFSANGIAKKIKTQICGEIAYPQPNAEHYIIYNSDVGYKVLSLDQTALNANGSSVTCNATMSPGINSSVVTAGTSSSRHLKLTMPANTNSAAIYRFNIGLIRNAIP